MTGLRLILAGAAIGNGNRGVEALAKSVIDSVDRRRQHSVMSILDDGWGVRAPTDSRYEHTQVEYVGVRRSRRWHRPESWAQIRVAQRFSLLNNPVAQRIAAADAVLDLSAGDSFTDLYGAVRLATVSAPKHAALRAGRPLVLLPQTYGPFATDAGRRTAERIVRSATVAYARDPWSYDRLVELAGADADPTRLRRGVDVAFALEPRRPVQEVADQVAGWAAGLSAGVNVSGLLRDEAGHARFGLKGDYLDTMTEVVRGLHSRGAQVVFIPHVHEPSGMGESDMLAIREIWNRMGPHEKRRTSVLSETLDAAEIKWCIAQLDWFVGSRMHSTIAGLSTLTPTAGYAYSDKTLGVFQTCGMGDHVVDARDAAGEEATQAILASFDQRDSVRDELRALAPDTIGSSRQQLQDVFDLVDRWRHGSSPAESIA